MNATDDSSAGGYPLSTQPFPPLEPGMAPKAIIYTTIIIVLNVITILRMIMLIPIIAKLHNLVRLLVPRDGSLAMSRLVATAPWSGSSSSFRARTGMVSRSADGKGETQ